MGVLEVVSKLCPPKIGGIFGNRWEVLKPLVVKSMANALKKSYTS
jgi:hypothetical protein